MNTDDIKDATIRDRTAAEQANAMPFLKILHWEDDFERGIVEHERAFDLTVEFSKGQLFVSCWEMSDLGKKEIYYYDSGTHPRYGNFVRLVSARGPGDGPRQRPMFLFHDNEPVFL